ncbi:MAG: hypothetical protein E6G58_00535 [Actinobacteria bacterium]|nr:MAG: hypothetical protein E6G58_00535 [Actinomycetota bacterium]
MLADTCLGFNVACGTLFKGGGVVLAGFILFVGSVYVLLAAVFGRWMGYLVLMIAFSGWMIIQSSIWMFGFWSQGPDTKTNLGPRGSEPAWQVIDAGLSPGAETYTEFSQYPNPPTWSPPNAVTQAADIQSVQGAATSFLANQANATLGRAATALDAIQTTQFAVDSLEFAKAGNGTPIAVVQAHFIGGGPETVLSMKYNQGSVPRYSLMFLVGSILLFAIHLPLLDRAERSRKAFLTGGSAPPWYGPA